MRTPLHLDKQGIHSFCRVPPPSPLRPPPFRRLGQCQHCLCAHLEWYVLSLLKFRCCLYSLQGIRTLLLLCFPHLLLLPFLQRGARGLRFVERSHKSCQECLAQWTADLTAERLQRGCQADPPLPSWCFPIVPQSGIAFQGPPPLG